MKGGGACITPLPSQVLDTVQNKTTACSYTPRSLQMQPELATAQTVLDSVRISMLV